MKRTYLYTPLITLLVGVLSACGTAAPTSAPSDSATPTATASSPAGNGQGVTGVGLPPESKAEPWGQLDASMQQHARQIAINGGHILLIWGSEVIWIDEAARDSLSADEVTWIETVVKEHAGEEPVYYITNIGTPEMMAWQWKSDDTGRFADSPIPYTD